MAGEKTTFPHRDLNQAEQEDLGLILGSPTPTRQRWQFFAQVGGKPLMAGNLSLTNYMARAMEHTWNFLDTARSRERAEAFAAGSLLYAGVFQHVARADYIPVQDAALYELRSLSDANFVIRVMERLQDEAKGFCQLLTEVLPAADVSGSHSEIAIIGAGALHAAILESENPETYTSGAIKAAHPELFEDIESIFQNLAPPEF